MKNQTCSQCEKQKPTLKCELCQVSLCKSCCEFLDAESFALLPEIPPELSHSAYCVSCMTNKIAPELEKYQQLIAQAKEILVFNDKQGKETRLLKRDQPLVAVSECADYDQMILKMALMAVQANCNALIDIKTWSKKIKNGSYTTTLWFGSGRPAQVNPSHLPKDHSIWQNPN